MATIEYRRIVWLLNTINVHQPITREDINYYYRHDDWVNPFERDEIPLRTFQKTLRQIEDSFKDIFVKCNRATNEYYLVGAKEAGLSKTRKVTTVDLAKRELQHWNESNNVPIQLFRIDATPDATERLLEHPICKEQKLVSTDKKTGISIFEYLMRPTWEWYEAIRSLGAAVKILYPYWLVELILEDVTGIKQMYEEGDWDSPYRQTFINPYDCRIVETEKKSLYLNIDQMFLDAYLGGSETEYNVRITPDNMMHLIQTDEKGLEIRDEEGNAMPIHYDTIHFKVGSNSDADEAIFEVKKIETFQLTTDDDGPQRQFVTDANGNVLRDDDGKYIKPEFDQQGNCINGYLWNEEVITFTLGKVLDTMINEKN
ncbi:MAG: hypothetical protein MJZ79_00285 [Paludibacteraceae bacterium]|nr:hypothetical protein [Paludibacteraceae bacterium]